MTNTEVNRSGWRRARLALAAPLLLAVTMAPICGGGPVKIPPASEDHAPLVTIGHVFLNGSGTLDPWEVSSDKEPRTVTVTESSTCVPHLMVTANARNPGGVKEISIVVTHDGLQEPLYQVTTTAAPDSTTNQVPDQLSIIGTDGNGAAGPKPLEISYDGELEGDCAHNREFTVTAEATNFNGQTTTIREVVQGLNNRCCP